MRRAWYAAVVLLSSVPLAAEEAHVQGDTLEELRRENAELRRRLATCAAGVGERGPVSSDGHGATVFFTLCGGSEYFDTYCGPFLLSFENTYGAQAARHRIVVFIASVREEQVETAQKRFGHFAEFRWYGEKAEGSLYSETIGLQCGDASEERIHRTGPTSSIKSTNTNCQATGADENTRNLKTAFDSLLFPLRVAEYVRANLTGSESNRYCYFALVDSDMLFVRPLDAFLPPCDGGWDSAIDWDVGFTYYDKQYIVPWADDVSAVARTRSGYVRLNCGVSLFSLRDPALACRFLEEWVSIGHTILLRTTSDDDDDKSVSTAKWMIDEFRGPDQTALVMLLVSLDLSRLNEVLGWDKCAVCGASVQAALPLGEENARTQHVRLRGFLARQLNHAESMPCGRFARDLHIVHLKGMWWRQLLPNGNVNLVDPTRNLAWNYDAWVYYQEHFKQWQLAVPDAERIKHHATYGDRSDVGPEVPSDSHLRAIELAMMRHAAPRTS